MAFGRSLVLFFVLGLVAPGAFAAAPGPMRVAGELLVNGAPPPLGTPIAVRIAGSGDLALGALAEGGAFALEVPGDDPTTAAREGPREGEPLEFHALGGRALAPVAFAPGAERTGIELALTLPDLVLVGLGAEPREVAEGENVTVRGSLANRGRIAATLVRVVVSDGAQTLATQFVGDVAANATVGFSVALGTTGLSGERALRVQALATNGDADPATDVGSAGIAVDANEPPLVRDLRRVPLAPAPGETVALVLDAEDPDGISHVEFVWSVANETQRAVVAREPWQTVLGGFAEGTSVRYWAVVTDAGPLARATTTPVQAFDVRAGEPAATPAVSPTAGDVDGAPATPTPSPGADAARDAPWPALAGLAALGAVAYLRRRST